METDLAKIKEEKKKEIHELLEKVPRKARDAINGIVLSVLIAMYRPENKTVLDFAEILYLNSLKNLLECLVGCSGK